MQHFGGERFDNLYTHETHSSQRWPDFYLHWFSFTPHPDPARGHLVNNNDNPEGKSPTQVEHIYWGQIMLAFCQKNKTKE